MKLPEPATIQAYGMALMPWVGGIIALICAIGIYKHGIFGFLAR